MTLLEIITAACEGTDWSAWDRGRWVEIWTDQLDRHNDRVCVYAKIDEASGGIVLTDYSELILDMTACGSYDTASSHLLDSCSVFYHQRSKERPSRTVYRALGPDANWADAALWFWADSLEPDIIRTGIAELAKKISQISNSYNP